MNAERNCDRFSQDGCVDTLNRLLQDVVAKHKDGGSIFLSECYTH